MLYLLERIAARPETSFGQEEAFDLQAAVAAQIQRIVSSRPVNPHGGGTNLLEFGMPSIVEYSYGSKAELKRYGDRLARQIVHYEPRLKQPVVTVKPAHDGKSPYQLTVSGTLAPDGDAATFRFDLSEH